MDETWYGGSNATAVRRVPPSALGDCSATVDLLVHESPGHRHDARLDTA
jgi:hypothetical protein